MINATCHCGKISIDVVTRPASVTECNCSVCRRYAARWAYYSRSQVTINATHDAMSAYCWGDRSIEFYHCNNCGCITHYESIEKQDDSRVAVNVRMMMPEDQSGIPVKRFDGADTWRFIE